MPRTLIRDAEVSGPISMDSGLAMMDLSVGAKDSSMSTGVPGPVLDGFGLGR